MPNRFVKSRAEQGPVHRAVVLRRPRGELEFIAPVVVAASMKTLGNRLMGELVHGRATDAAANACDDVRAQSRPAARAESDRLPSIRKLTEP